MIYFMINIDFSRFFIQKQAKGNANNLCWRLNKMYRRLQVIIRRVGALNLQWMVFFCSHAPWVERNWRRFGTQNTVITICNIFDLPRLFASHTVPFIYPVKTVKRWFGPISLGKRANSDSSEKMSQAMMTGQCHVRYVSGQCNITVATPISYE